MTAAIETRLRLLVDQALHDLPLDALDSGSLQGFVPSLSTTKDETLEPRLLLTARLIAISARLAQLSGEPLETAHNNLVDRCVLEIRELYDGLAAVQPSTVALTTPHLGQMSRELDADMSDSKPSDVRARAFAMHAIEWSHCLLPEVDLDAGRWSATELEPVVREAQLSLHDYESTSIPLLFAHRPAGGAGVAFVALDHLEASDSPTTIEARPLWLLVAGGAMLTASQIDRTEPPGSGGHAGPYDRRHIGHAVMALSRSQLRSDPRSFPGSKASRYIRTHLKRRSSTGSVTVAC